MTTHSRSIASATAPLDPSTAPVRPRSDRLTVAAAVSLFVICGGHTLFFAFHPWWGAWLAGPLRAEEPPLEAAVQFWALPGGIVVPAVLLSLLILREGRRGRTVPVAVGIVLAVWSLACLWMVGPSGFASLLVPAVLLLAASVRARGSAGGRHRSIAR